jgi:putative DNA primase/helicase
MDFDVERFKSNFPQEIKDLRRFLLWRREWNEKQGQWRKVPYRAVGRKASSSNPQTWNTFDNVLATYEKAPDWFSGIGITLGDGITGIDLDHVIDKEGKLDPVAAEIVASMPGYIERSPSGEGLHILVKGSLPTPGERKHLKFPNVLGFKPVPIPEGEDPKKISQPAIEFYDETSSRYFTATGDVWDGRSVLNTEEASGAIAAFYWRVQKALDDLNEAQKGAKAAGIAKKTAEAAAKIAAKAAEKAEKAAKAAKKAKKPKERVVKKAKKNFTPFDYENDDALLRRIRKSKQGPKFSQLFDVGDISGYPSPSEARGALLCVLAFWTRRDEARTDRLFRQSAIFTLDPEKWERPQNGETLGSIEIRNACALVKEVHDPQYAEDGDEFNFGYALNDSGNAQRIVDTNGEDIRFCEAWDKWLVWDGRRWEVGAKYQMVRYAAGVVKDLIKRADQLRHEIEMLEEAKKGLDRGSLADVSPELEKLQAEIQGKEQLANALEAFAQKSGDGPRVSRMINLAASGENIPITQGELDQGKFLLNVGNGTLDLKTGNLRSFSRADFITRVIDTEYNEDAECPIWGTFLTRIFNGSADLIDFMQRAIGYSLTGDTSEQCIFILHGNGSNGKSTMLEALRYVLKDYAQNTPSSTFIEKRNESEAGYDLATLRGARLVTSVETKKNRTLDEGLIKTATGGDPITCRLMRQDFWSYMPEFKLFMATNHLPAIKGTDHGIWRRIRCVPFNATISDEEKDKTLPDKLKREAPGILAWAVRGCHKWLKEGLGMPREVQAATEVYRDDQDFLKDFLDEYCVIGAGNIIERQTLYATYGGWAKSQGLFVISLTKFTQEIKARGFDTRETRQRQGGGIVKLRYYVGITLAKSANIPLVPFYNAGE